MQVNSDVEPNGELTLNLPIWFKSELFISILFFLLGFLLYSLSLGNEFVWDDVEVIKKSYFNFENANLKSIFIPAVKETKKLLYYRPTIPISYIADWNNWKLNPFGYHLSNSIFYSFTIVAMFFYSTCLQGFSASGGRLHFQFLPHCSLPYIQCMLSQYRGLPEELMYCVLCFSFLLSVFISYPIKSYILFLSYVFFFCFHFFLKR